jgi:hypothetical protein
MPNWCECKLRLKGDKYDILDCISFVEEGDNLFSANKILPYPEKYKNADDNSKDFVGFNNGGKDWCVENWGCKWPPCEISFDKNCYYFSTPWSPPIPLIRRLSCLFHRIEFILWYWECGMGFKGKAIIQNGCVLEHNTGAYNGPRGG